MRLAFIWWWRRIQEWLCGEPKITSEPRAMWIGPPGEVKFDARMEP